MYLLIGRREDQLLLCGQLVDLDFHFSNGILRQQKIDQSHQKECIFKLYLVNSGPPLNIKCLEQLL